MTAWATTIPDSLLWAKKVVPVVLLALLWCWETWRPFFRHHQRGRHAARNLGLAVVNTVVIGLMFGTVTLLVTEGTATHGLGLLNLLVLADPWQFLLALMLLDAWMYLWHRANHLLPFLWRFHRVHHSDTQMDVTTATRFHTGELFLSAGLRLGLIPLLGLDLWHLVAYDTLVLAVIQFHHADISLGVLDRWLNLLIVTPNMHKVHHSDERPEMDSNFATIFSFWDRLAGTFRRRSDLRSLRFGLPEFAAPVWQTWWRLWAIPFISAEPTAPAATPHDEPTRVPQRLAG